MHSCFICIVAHLLSLVVREAGKCDVRGMLHVLKERKKNPRPVLCGKGKSCDTPRHELINHSTTQWDGICIKG